MFNPLMRCTIINNVITMYDPFVVMYTPDEDDPLSFVLPTITMPFSIKPTAATIVETFIILDDNPYSVDYTAQENTFIATTGSFTDTIIEA